MKCAAHESMAGPSWDGVGALVRVRCQLEPREDALLSPGAETLWAKRLPDGFEIDNIPFYVFGLSCHDVVSATWVVGELYDFRFVVRESGHSTLRVILLEGLKGVGAIRQRTDSLRASIAGMGCETEAMRPGFIAIDVPPQVPISGVRAYLDAGEVEGVWGYEEGVVRQRD